MEILLYHQNKKILELLKFLIESQYGACTHETTSFSDTVDYLINHDTIHLVVAGSNTESQKLLKFLNTLKVKIPIILVQDSNLEKMEYLNQKHLTVIHLTEIQDILIKKIETTCDAESLTAKQENYCKINANLLASISNVYCDIYIKLSDHNYVKLFKAGTAFSKEETQKLVESKRIRSLYVQTKDIKVFIDCLCKELVSIGETPQSQPDQLQTTIARTNELMHDIYQKIGFSSEVQALAKESVNLTLKMIGSHPKISKALSQSLVKGQNYIASHSLLLANVSCAIAAKMEWPSNTTFHKLVLASLFHDFTLSDVQMAKISTLEELNGRRSQSEEFYKEVFSHPLKSAELLRSMKEIPGDVDFLVFQHHERPDGSGFPKGLKSHQIVAISAVFIFAHEMVDEILKLNNEFNLEKYLIKIAPIYNSGIFKKIWNILADKN